MEKQSGRDTNLRHFVTCRRRERQPSDAEDFASGSCRFLALFTFGVLMAPAGQIGKAVHCQEIAVGNCCIGRNSSPIALIEA
jgi:hypothetical protein